MMKQEIFWRIEKYISQETAVVVGVSWWPDSMMLAYCIQEFYKKKWRSQEKITIAHYNHGQRKESPQEYIFLKKHFSHNIFYRNTTIPPKKSSETTLRLYRHDFFSFVMQDTKSTHLFLWHNLTDRIETTLLNMVRGAHTKWLLWIKSTEKKKEYTIYRPLLSLPKKDIQAFCEKYHIPYFIDKTNSQNETPRNTVRNEIIPAIQKLHTGWEKKRLSSWNTLYHVIEKKQQQQGDIFPVVSHTIPSFWWAKTRYTIPKSSATKTSLSTVLSPYTYITTDVLHTLTVFIEKHHTGHMMIAWWYLFVMKDAIHLIYGDKKFREHKTDKQKPITHSWLLQFDTQIYTIKEERIGAVIRYPQKGDMLWQKKLSKILLNKKIPLFMRSSVPVIAHKNTILAVLF